LFALQFFLSRPTLISRPVCARTRAQLRGNIGKDSILPARSFVTDRPFEWIPVADIRGGNPVMVGYRVWHEKVKILTWKSKT